MGKGDVPNGVRLVVTNCVEHTETVAGTRKYRYVYTFSVTLSNSKPAPKFLEPNKTLHAYFSAEPDNGADHTRYALYVQYDNTIPTTALPPAPNPGYTTYSGLTHTTEWRDFPVNRGEVIFMGTNTQSGKKVRAKASTSVNKVGGDVPSC